MCWPTLIFLAILFALVVVVAFVWAVPNDESYSQGGGN